MLRLTHRTFFILLGLFFVAPVFSEAVQLTSMSDLLMYSEPGKNTSHIITFTNSSEIPASGEIRVKFEGKGAPFIFSPVFDYSNLLFSINRFGYTEDIGLDSYSDSATGTAMLIPNGDGEISIRLPYDPYYTIPTNSKIQIKIGGNQINSDAILNPSVIDSHLLTITTYNDSGDLIDIGKTMIATTPLIGMKTEVKGIAATIFNGLPKGLIPGGTKKVFISAETNIPSYCRYSLTPNIEYADMPSSQTLKYANFFRLHYFIIDVADGGKYVYYLRCFSKFGLELNNVDYVISFEVGVTNREITPPAPPPGTQSGSGLGGGNMLQQSDLNIIGKTFPGSQVSILKDGKEFSVLTADSQGNFSTSVNEMDRGTYGFTITSILETMRSAPYTTTLYMNGNTRNTIGPVYLSPVVTSKTQRTDVGGRVLVYGKAVPLHTIQAVLVSPRDMLQQPFILSTTTANGAGDWTLNLDTSKLVKGTYALKVQTLVPGQGNSQFSPDFLIGIGETPQGNNKMRADLNRDGKVNLADLSILLYNWRKTTPAADINIDGIVNITDFSIMLAAWTA